MDNAYQLSALKSLNDLDGSSPPSIFYKNLSKSLKRNFSHADIVAILNNFTPHIPDPEAPPTPSRTHFNIYALIINDNIFALIINDITFSLTS